MPLFCTSPRLTSFDPGKPDGYLETATIFWDYYRYDDAVRWIDTARTRLNQPAGWLG